MFYDGVQFSAEFSLIFISMTTLTKLEIELAELSQVLSLATHVAIYFNLYSCVFQQLRWKSNGWWRRQSETCRDVGERERTGDIQTHREKRLDEDSVRDILTKIFVEFVKF